MQHLRNWCESRQLNEAFQGRFHHQLCSQQPCVCVSDTTTKVTCTTTFVLYYANAPALNHRERWPVNRTCDLTSAVGSPHVDSVRTDQTSLHRSESCFAHHHCLVVGRRTGQTMRVRRRGVVERVSRDHSQNFNDRRSSRG